jgi:hypothetical protein
MIGKPLGQTVTTTARYTPPAAAANQVAQSIVHSAHKTNLISSLVRYPG